MARTNSPLRYPGGKSCLYWLAADILRLNGLERGHYAEPYAGGGGLALSLLYGGHVAEIHLNDIDPAIWSFWHSALNDTSEFLQKIAHTPVTIEEWFRQRDIYRGRRNANSLDLAFATFFLNRTNRSGIIGGGGVIGGIDQTGPYKIDCRFNTDDLMRRVRRVARYRDRIHLTNKDAIDFMERLDVELPKRSLWFIDPPYYHKGSDLYTNFYKKDDHIEVATIVGNLQTPHVVTYDDTPEIRRLYRDRRQYVFNISYSVSKKRTETELLIASPGLKSPTSIRERLVHRPQYRAA